MIDKQKHREFRKLVDQILWEEWDPIGVNDAPEERDEYSSYAGEVCGKLWNGEDKQAIFDYLFWVETEHMGLGTKTSSKEAINARNSILVDKILKLFSEYQ